MTTTCRALSSNVRPAHLHEAPGAGAPSRVTDFLPARDRWQQETDEASKLVQIEHEVRKAAALRKSSIDLYDPLEDWLYSLIPAAAIVALLIGVLGLLDSQNPPAQTTRTAVVTERSVPSQGRDGKF